MSEYWIQTYTGKRFDLECPIADMICIEDIAHQLSMENRWHGATKIPISVAYHSVLVANFARKEIKLEALFHDAAEAYYKDFANPWKRLIKASVNDNLWDRTFYWLDSMIAEIFQLSTDSNVWNEIKAIDVRMPKSERIALCAPPPMQYLPEYENAEPYKIDFMDLRPREAEELFLSVYNDYKRT